MLLVLVGSAKNTNAVTADRDPATSLKCTALMPPMRSQNAQLIFRALVGGAHCRDLAVSVVGDT